MEWYALGITAALSAVALVTISDRRCRVPLPLGGVVLLCLAGLAGAETLEGAVRGMAGLLLFSLAAGRSRAQDPSSDRWIFGLGLAAALFLLCVRDGYRLWMASSLEAAGTAGLLLLAGTGPGAVGLLAAGLALLLGVLSSSRALYIGFGAAFLLRLLLHFGKERRLAPRALPLALLLVLGAIGALRIHARVAGDPLAWSRPRFWAAGAEMLICSPLGSGLGAYPSLEGHYRTPDPTPVRGLRRATHAHSDLVEIAVETGLPGAGLLLLFLAETFFRARGEPAGNAGLLPALVLLLFFYPLRVGPQLMCLAWIAGKAWREREASSGLVADGRLGLFLCLPALLLGGLGFLAYAFHAAGASPAVSAGLAPTEGYFHTLSAAPGTGERPGSQPRPHPEGILRAYSLDPRSPVRRENLAILSQRLGETRTAVAALYDTLRSEENNAMHLIQIAEGQARLGRWGPAREALERAAAQEPLAVGAREALAMLSPDARDARRWARDADVARALLRAEARRGEPPGNVAALVRRPVLPSQ